MIWNVDYFHNSAFSVVCIFLNELDILFWKFLLYWVDNATLRLTMMMWCLCRGRNIARVGTNSHRHSYLRKAKSYDNITRHHKRSTTSSGRFSNGEYPNFHSNTHLGETHCYFDLTRTSHIVQWTFSPMRMSSQGNRYLTIEKD